MKQHWQKKLEQLGYTYDTNVKIWCRPDYQGIAYNDGDEVETRIANAIAGAQDISVLSAEMRQHCIDWASLYHLSGARANLMRPFGPVFESGASVLEVGAGCGAITRYMGECEADVLALEGTPRRAAIARSRTRDLANVTVLSERFSDFAPPADVQFDVITLIGVLEYANLFTPSSNPHLSMLKRVRQLLKPYGVVIIAIENQLGLKYFAGAPEDHLGQPMYGIEGRYQANQPQTFGLVAMKALLQDAGFVQNQFMSPIPDYKLPTSILTESGFINPQFDSSALMCQGARNDPQLPSLTNFSLELAWPEINKNGLALDMANSFLIAAMPTAGQQTVDSSILAYHYSTGRFPKYCKKTLFVEKGHNIVLKVSRIVAPHTGKVEGDLLNQHIEPQQTYNHGELLSQRFVKLVARDGWTLEQLQDYLQTWLCILQMQAQRFGGDFNLAQANVNSMLPGECIDCVAQNIILNGNEASEFIDKEWSSVQPVKLGHLIFRQVLMLLKSVSHFGVCADQHPMFRLDFMKHAYRSISLDVTDENLSAYNLQEAIIQQSVTGMNHEHFIDWQPQSHINYKSVHHQNAAMQAERNVTEQLREDVQAKQAETEQLHEDLQAKQAETEQLREDLQAKQAETEQLRNDVQTKQAEAEHLRNEFETKISDFDSRYNSILSSNSWKYTYYLRRAGNILRKILRIKNAVTEFGGLSSAYNKIYYTIKTESFSAFLKKTRNYINDRKRDLPLTGLSAEVASSHLEKRRFEPHSIPVVNFDPTKDQFTQYKKNSPLKNAIRPISFYLPQFHPFPENDSWWGKGFTEWSNVGKALPNYQGHYQPHCPIHLGYYDLRVKEIMEEQARLAKNYGIYGFNYYFYWFGGKILMDLPLEQMLQNKDVDIPFCLTWANENWTRRWDGQENDVLIAQSHSEQDSIAFIQHLIKYFNDKRYIRINDCPVILIYRANIIPKMKETLELWRDEVKRHGFKNIYAVCCQTFGLKDPNEYGFDAAAEFPPHTIKSSDITERLRVINPSYKGHVYSYDEVVENATRETEPEFKLFRTAMLSWDNTARKQDQSHVFHGFSLVRYKQWLSTLCNNVFHNKKYAEEEKIVFINAWNEWAEGTHLEPDRKYGYGYLQATYDVISNYDFASEIDFGLSNVARSSKYAVIIHAHYQDVLIKLLDRLKNLDSFKFDLYVTSSDANLLRLVKAEFPLANLHLIENRGRDILPFIEVLRIIANMGYSAVCKLHTKKSVYRTDGDLICDRLFSGLIGDVAHVESIVGTFSSNLSVGMVVTAASLVPHSDHNMTYDHDVVDFISKRCGVEFEYSNFPAGSMFWFRPEALLPLLALAKQDFPVELGLADGTLAHGVERMFTRLVVFSGFQVVAV